jgi:hypothetical protein
MKFFVIGSVSFIGSHLVEKLIVLGHKVNSFIFCNSRGSNEWLDVFVFALTKFFFGAVINIRGQFDIFIKDILNIFKKDFGYDFKIVIDKKRVRSNKTEVFRLLASDIKSKNFYIGSQNIGTSLGLKRV